MTFNGLYTTLSVLWITFPSSIQEAHEVRIKLNHQHMTFPTLNLPNAHNHTVQKLVKDSSGKNVYVGSPQGLYMIDSPSGPLTQIHVPLFGTCDKDNYTICEYKISLLEEGTNEHTLFICGEREEMTMCCTVNSEHQPVDCFEIEYSLHINEPSLYVGDILFFTYSGKNDDLNVGLYKHMKTDIIRPVPTQNEQRYIKLIMNKRSTSLGSKLYSLYIEKNTNNDPETPRWIPRVSQICMDDRGGPKGSLQMCWTSMLTARLFCGDEKERISFTELLDVVVLEAEDWSDSMIYALFKNDYNVSAICVYKMADISRTFASSRFMQTNVPQSPRPGECVSVGSFSPDFLKFMANHPEMKDWIKPSDGPTLISHHHYTHLQVDKVEGRGNVLLIALESGRIHKVLEKEGETFFIAEYQPFTSKTRVQSMLLDPATKQLYVSSSTEMVAVDLTNCSLYGTQCCLCMQARDPHCGWSVLTSSCSPINEHTIQNLTGDCTVCTEDVLINLLSKPRSTLASTVITQGSTYHLNCPVVSHHASYTWDQGGRRRECVSTEQGCLLLLDSVTKDDEGTYDCIASENGQDILVASRQLYVNSAPWPRVTPLVLVCLLLLLSVIT